MQNQQKQNKITPILPSQNQKNYRLLKCKGKPFWLNLSQKKNNNYQKYKHELNPQTSFIINQSQQITTAYQYPNPTPQKQSYLQSLQSFNQNYDQDFQSYKSTIKHQHKQQIIKQENHYKSVSSQKLNIKLLLLQSKLINTPKRKANFSSISRIKTEKIPRIKTQIRVKTQQPLKSQSVDIQKQIYMNQNSKFLQRQNQRMLEIIKQMRKLLPILRRNQQQIKQQMMEIHSLKRQVQRATSAEYGFELQKSRTLLDQNKKSIQRNIKKLNSPKKHPPQVSTFRNFNDLIIPSKQQQVREELLCKLRLSTLREEKSLKLDNKIKLYQQIINKISIKQKINSYSTLQRRKIFLQWDIQKMKNQYDLKILEQNLQINSQVEQIQISEKRIFQNQKQIKKIIKKEKEKKNEEIPKILQLQVIESPQKLKNKAKQIKTFEKNSPSGLKTIFYKKVQTQKQILSLNQKSLPQIRQNKKTPIPSSQSSRNTKQKPIIIKKCAFNNATLNLDIQELIL